MAQWVESTCSAGDVGSIPGSGRCPGEGNGNPLQFSSWEIPWTEQPGRLQSMGSQKSRNNLETEQKQQLASLGSGLDTYTPVIKA